MERRYMMCMYIVYRLIILRDNLYSSSLVDTNLKKKGKNTEYTTTKYIDAMFTRLS